MFRSPESSGFCFSARRLRGGVCWLGTLLSTLAGVGELPAQAPKFEKVVIDGDIGAVCYGLLLTDIDGDQKTDIVAVTENRVLWYQAPSWKRFTILEDQTIRDNVCLAAADINGDGKTDLALGAGWTKVGTIGWLKQGPDGGQPWQLFDIDREPWTHRMSFADVLGLGTPQLIVSPLNKTQGNGVRLMAFQIPNNPESQRWMPVLLNQELNRMHNHAHHDWTGNGDVETLTASDVGISLIRKNEAGEWTRKALTDSGAGEVRVGQLSDDGGRFLATIEPMHGTDVVVYVPQQDDWVRHRLDGSLGQGHALITADLDGDGTDEVVAGHREASKAESRGPGLFLYQAKDATGADWTRHAIDVGGIAVEDAKAADLDGDGRIDIVAGGRGTRNLNLYLNRGK